LWQGTEEKGDVFTIQSSIGDVSMYREAVREWKGVQNLAKCKVAMYLEIAFIHVSTLD
jgi:hypothetical protein